MCSISTSSRPDTIVDESEEVPLGTSLGLEIPEDPSTSRSFERVDLRLDVLRSCGLHALVPLVDEVLGCAGADVRGGSALRSGVCAVVASANAITVLEEHVSIENHLDPLGKVEKELEDFVELTSAGAQSVIAAVHSPMISRRSLPSQDEAIEDTASIWPCHDRATSALVKT